MKSLFCIISVLFGMAIVSEASAQVLDCTPGRITANAGVLLSCPKGDGYTLAEKGLTIYVQVLDANFQPIPGIPADDMWLVGVPTTEELFLCGGSAATHADAPTDGEGRTRFSGALAVGGCADGLYVVVQGCIIRNEANGIPIIVPVQVRSADIAPNGGDGRVSLSDYSALQVLFQNGQYDKCIDFNGDGQENLPDVSLWSYHYKVPEHRCSLP